MSNIKEKKTSLKELFSPRIEELVLAGQKLKVSVVETKEQQKQNKAYLSECRTLLKEIKEERMKETSKLDDLKKVAISTEKMLGESVTILLQEITDRNNAFDEKEKERFRLEAVKQAEAQAEQIRLENLKLKYNKFIDYVGEQLKKRLFTAVETYGAKAYDSVLNRIEPLCIQYVTEYRELAEELGQETNSTYCKLIVSYIKEEFTEIIIKAKEGIEKVEVVESKIPIVANVAELKAVAEKKAMAKVKVSALTATITTEIDWNDWYQKGIEAGIFTHDDWVNKMQGFANKCKKKNLDVRGLIIS